MAVRAQGERASGPAAKQKGGKDDRGLREMGGSFERNYPISRGCIADKAHPWLMWRNANVRSVPPQTGERKSRLSERAGQG